MTRFQDKVAIVTGAGRGIGAAIARGFAAEGARVVVADVDSSSAGRTSAAIRESGGHALACAADVVNRAQVEQLVEESLRAYGTIDILVNNAGITRAAMIHKMTEQEWEQVLAVNLTGVFHCTQIVGRIMMEKARNFPDAAANGKIINISSVAGLRGTIGQINYAAAKAGVIGVTMSAAREWGRYGINVNGVAFGLVETDMTETIRTDPKFREQYLQQIALRRYAKPEDVAPAVLFLASPAADYITGQILSVCGGVDIHA
ncbi:MAG: glucose 1-dehydrogenase [Gammaproteobacteria bacterium]|nr:glucose 1-dehydrogenase [Gammaproteobacteria bacterium]